MFWNLWKQFCIFFTREVMVWKLSSILYPKPWISQESSQVFSLNRNAQVGNIDTTRVSSRDVGTGNFPFLAFLIAGKFVSGSPEIAYVWTILRCSSANFNLFKLEHHCGENCLVMRKLRSSHFSLDCDLILVFYDYGVVSVP